MARGKGVKKLLLDALRAAMFAGIEIHNKPNISYRYPTAIILIINAWELALKAYVYKFIGKKKIYEAFLKTTGSEEQAKIWIESNGQKCIEIAYSYLSAKENEMLIETIDSNWKFINEQISKTFKGEKTRVKNLEK